MLDLFDVTCKPIFTNPLWLHIYYPKIQEDYAHFVHSRQFSYVKLWMKWIYMYIKTDKPSVIYTECCLKVTENKTFCHKVYERFVTMSNMADVGVSTSPRLDASPAESSSDDSDDSLPLAQLALKRQEKNANASSSHEDSPEPPSPKPGPKKRGPKKQKKKKDPNAPKRPASAYAAFFKDTHAAIRGQNPNAGIGEVSKIVASMWEGLDPENKDTYKKNAEVAKMEYLKELTAYKASLASENGLENGPVLTVKPIATSGKKPRLKAKGRPKAMFSVKPIGRRTRQQQAQKKLPDESNGLSPVEENSPPTESPPQASPASMSPPQPDVIEEVQPESAASPVQAEMDYSSPPHLENQHSPVEIAPKPSNNDGGSQVYSKWCIRSGCSNVALDNPGWDNEYCSNECVVSHCRDVFTAWVASRQSSN